MKVYFSGSLSGKKLFKDEYRLVVGALKELGHEVIWEYLFKVEIDDVLKQSEDEQIAVHEQLEQWKRECDVVVAELSYRSFAQGQEVAHAFRIGKPVLGLHVQGKRPHLILSDAGDRLLLQEYSKNNLGAVLEAGLEYLDPGEWKRFTLLLPSQLIDHLDEIARKDLSRSEYIRSLIKKDMEKK